MQNEFNGATNILPTTIPDWVIMPTERMGLPTIYKAYCPRCQNCVLEYTIESKLTPREVTCCGVSDKFWVTKSYGNK